MTNDHDMKLLSDELHDLAGDIAPSSSAAARDRARRGIARHSRNRRTAVAAAGVVVVVAAAAFVAVDRDTKDSRRPIGTTTPSVSVAPTTTSTSTLPGSPILSTIPTLGDLPTATASYSKTFPWGTADDQVAFHTPQGEGVSGGPVAFTADAAGNIVMLDHSNSRLVRFEHGSASTVPIALASPAVTAAAFDDRGRVIVATVADLAVFGPQGQAEGSWSAISKDGDAINHLEVDGNRVYALPTYSADQSFRTLLLRDDGSGYVPVRDSAQKIGVIDVGMTPTDGPGARRTLRLTVSASGKEYRVTTPDSILDLRALRLLPDGSVTFVLRLEHDPPDPTKYVLGRIDSVGSAHYATVSASDGYLVNGPGFVINDDGVAVMRSTTTGGVTVSYYPFA
jgi:hypothetical protein